MISELQAADYIVNHYSNPKADFKYAINDWKLNELVFYLNMICKVVNHHWLIFHSDTHFQLDDMGVTDKDLFAIYKRFKMTVIPKHIHHVVHFSFSKNGSISMRTHEFKDNELPTADKDFLDRYVPNLLRYSLWDLVSLERKEPQVAQYTFYDWGKKYDLAKGAEYYALPKHQFWTHKDVQFPLKEELNVLNNQEKVIEQRKQAIEKKLH